MAQVSITINGRTYPVACNEGEEERIHELARGIDTRVAQFARHFGQAGEARLLVLAALVMADELAEAHETIKRLGSGQPGSDQPDASQRGASLPVDAPSGAEQAALAGNVSRLAQRIEAVAVRLETSHI
jgi:cell division protein ZapA